MLYTKRCFLEQAEIALLSHVPSFTNHRIFFLGKLCPSWGDFSLVLCRLFDMLQTQQLSFNLWGPRNSQPTCGGKQGKREGGMWGRHKYSTMSSFWVTSSRLWFQWLHLQAMPAPCSKSKLTCGGGSHVLSLMSLQLLMLQKKSWG